MLLAILFGLMCAAAGAALAAKKNRNVIGWFLLCFVTGVIGIIVLAMMPAVPEEAEAAPALNYDVPGWQGLVAKDPVLVRAVDTLKPYGGGLVSQFAETYMAAADKSDPLALAQSLRDNRLTNPDYLLKKLEEHVNFFMHASAGNVAILKSGEALLERNGVVRKYPDAVALREAIKDDSQWPHIDDPDAKRKLALAIAPHVPAM